jgi:Ran GTPase-activating protein (RanGAP) involved in mRNA processing and transport
MSRKYHRKIFPVIKMMPNLKVLELNKNKIDQQRLQHLVSIKRTGFLPHLQTLKLANNKLGSQSLADLIGFLKLMGEPLEVLDLTGNRFKDNEAMEIINCDNSIHEEGGQLFQ